MGVGCLVEDCARPHEGLGYCRSHYVQMKRNGSTRPIRPTRAAGACLVRDDRGRKHCPACEVWLPLELFGRVLHTLDGLYDRCKPCVRLSRELHGYGLTPERKTGMLELQGGSCAICKIAFGPTNPTYIDHDHDCCPDIPACGKCIRGLLCRICNLGLGSFKDDPARLRSAANYLEENSL